uniref:Putative secreted protein n=1 Tax=Ixodes scapularis TaxID=6945 RepID=Q4PN62_IXOSC|nr:putative secreted protein [Ixodes scapularis]
MSAVIFIIFYDASLLLSSRVCHCELLESRFRLLRRVTT